MTTGSGGPHAVSQTVSGGQATAYTYDHRGNQVQRDAPGTANDRTIRYSLDDKAHEIQMGSGQRVRFWYGPDGQRYKREEAGKVTYYLGGVEAVVLGGATTFKRYVGGIALQTVSNGVVQSTKYLFHDQLGSLVRIANADGSLAERLDYMAFGGRRSPSDPHAAGTASPNTPRGYTGHEFVDGTGVIHMNGRIYDSELGRFLQADPVIQAPHNTQSWNAYTYVFNNPFAYTDPTGMISWRQVLGIVIIVVAAVTQQYWAINATAKFWGTVAVGAMAGGVSTGTWQGALWGAFSAAAFYGVGSYFEGAKWAQANSSGNVFGSGLNPAGYGAKVMAHGVTGGVMSKLQGGKFGHGFASASVTQAFAPGIDRIGGGASNYAGLRVAAAAVLGGTASKLSGGKFANGAVTAAFSRAFNDESHRRGRSSESRNNFDEGAEDAIQPLADRAYNALNKSPGTDGVVDLTLKEYTDVLEFERARIQMRSNIRGGYENLNPAEFRWELYNRGDSLFYGDYGDTLYRVAGLPPQFGGPFPGGDLNYVNQGMMFAAGGRSLGQLSGTVSSWNTIGGGTFHNNSQRLNIARFGYHYWRARNGK